jgi:hypothetical protein
MDQSISLLLLLVSFKKMSSVYPNLNVDTSASSSPVQGPKTPIRSSLVVGNTIKKTGPIVSRPLYATPKYQSHIVYNLNVLLRHTEPWNTLVLYTNELNIMYPFTPASVQSSVDSVRSNASITVNIKKNTALMKLYIDQLKDEYKQYVTVASAPSLSSSSAVAATSPSPINVIDLSGDDDDILQEPKTPGRSSKLYDDVADTFYKAFPIPEEKKDDVKAAVRAEVDQWSSKAVSEFGTVIVDDNTTPEKYEAASWEQLFGIIAACSGK